MCFHTEPCLSHDWERGIGCTHILFHIDTTRDTTMTARTHRRTNGKQPRLYPSNQINQILSKGQLHELQEQTATSCRSTQAQTMILEAQISGAVQHAITTLRRRQCTSEWSHTESIWIGTISCDTGKELEFQTPYSMQWQSSIRDYTITVTHIYPGETNCIYWRSLIVQFDQQQVMKQHEGS
jgi:hypothetical protein